MSEMEAKVVAEDVDVVELCALLQCLGFTVKSLDSSDGDISQDAGFGTRTVVIHCQSSGLHAVLENAKLSCSCPPAEQQNSGFWQVSGVAGGKQHDKTCTKKTERLENNDHPWDDFVSKWNVLRNPKATELESGSTILCTLPKIYRERVTKELQEIVRYIRHADLNMEKPPLSMSASLVDLGKDRSSLIELGKGNKSASLLELRTTPGKRQQSFKVDTPTRYRSLDALTSMKDEEEPQLTSLPHQLIAAGKKAMFRQSTYTICSTPGSITKRNKTSSPIQTPQNSMLDNLKEIENTAEILRNKLAAVIKEFVDDGGKNFNDSSSMLDVSKISLLKGEKSQFASSPNLSALRTVHEELPKSNLKRSESASTLKPQASKDMKSKMKSFAPSMFRMKKKSPTPPEDKINGGKSKVRSLFVPKIVKPICTTKTTNDAKSSPNLSASKKKFSHVKSTIPRPTPKKE